MAEIDRADRALVAAHQLVIGLERQLDEAREHRARQFALASERGRSAVEIAALAGLRSQSHVTPIVRVGRRALAELRRRRAQDEHAARRHPAPPREEATTR